MVDGTNYGSTIPSSGAVDDDNIIRLQMFRVYPYSHTNYSIYEAGILYQPEVLLLDCMCMRVPRS